MCQINTEQMKQQNGCLDVNVSPEIDYLKTSKDVVVQEGENVTLVCKASGHPTPRITWRREDGENIIRSPARDKRGEKKYEGENLTIARVTRAQMGAYLCIARNDVPPTVSKRISLNVNCEFSTDNKQLLIVVCSSCSGNSGSQPIAGLPVWSPGGG